MRVKFVNNLKTAVLLAALMALCMGIGYIWGPSGLVIGFVVGLLMVIFAPLTGAALANLFSTHPPTEKRIAALLRQE